MIHAIDYFLDRITMYKLVLYTLIVYVVAASVFALLGLIQFSPVSIIFSSLFLVGVCWAANKVMAFAFDAPTNVESVYITALILALIVTPIQTSGDFAFLFWVGVLAMASKYILAINKKHIFNPAAIAVLITSYAVSQSASWWIGTQWMMPFVLVGGLLIIRKLRFGDLAWGFFTTAIVVSLGITVFREGNIFTTLNQLALHSSFLFLGTIMLTEPITLPPTKQLQTISGIIVGFLSVPQVHLGSLYFAPELALCIGNIFAYIVSPKTKLLLLLQEKLQLSHDVIDFVFKPAKVPVFVPGQYMEWTLPHRHADTRGNRRYFTIASSPTEDTIRLGIKFAENGSSFKKALLQLDQKTPVVGAQIAGNFTLPPDSTKKLVFIAGGIGVTPYRSMIKYLVDTNQKRDIVLFYTNRTRDEIVYWDVFEQARTQLGIKTVYTLTKTDAVPPDWRGRVGHIDAAMITTEVPDYKDRTFYLSGSFGVVSALEQTLKGLGVKPDHIKKDFFPGLV